MTPAISTPVGTPATPARIKRILGIRMGHIGDVVLVTPALEVLSKMFPGAKISMLVRADTEPVLRQHPLVESVYTGGVIVSQQTMHVQKKTSLWRRLEQVPQGLKVIRELRRQHFDLCVDFTGGDRSAIYSYLSGATVRVGHSSRKKRLFSKDKLYSRLCYNSPTLQQKVWRDMDLLREVAAATGREDFIADGLQPGPSSIYPAADDLTWARSQWSAWAAPDALRVVVHPTSRVLYKCWPAERWAAVIDRLVVEQSASVTVTCGPDAKEMALARSVIAACRNKVHAQLGNLTLGRLAALMHEAKVYLGVDTAPMHMAAAVGARVVAVFGPSRHEVWGPWGKNHCVVRRPCPCLETGKRGCDETQGMDCLKALTVEEVYAATLKIAALES